MGIQRARFRKRVRNGLPVPLLGVGWYKQRYKLSCVCPVRPCSNTAFCSFASHGWERFNRSRNIQQFRVRVDAHCEPNVAVTHDSLCCPWCHTGPAEHRPECCSQGVDVDDSPAFVPLRDASQLQVLVHNLVESVWDSEQRLIRQHGIHPV